METSKPPEVAPALSADPARFEIVFAEDPKSALSLISPPLDDILEMSELRRQAYSLKEDGPQLETLKAAAIQRLLELQRKTDKFSNSSTFQNRLANLHGLVGNSSLEREATKSAARLATDPFFSRKLGDMYARLGERGDAVSIFESSWEGDSYSALRLASFGVIDQDFERAALWISRAVGLNPAGYAERLFEGAFRLVQNDFSGAISSLRIALDERPNSSVAYANLGFAYIGNNMPDRAYAALKRSISFDPFNKSALVAFSDVCAFLDKNYEAVHSLRSFVEFEQKDDAIWARLARSLLRTNQYDEALSALKMQGAIKASVSLWNNIAVVYHRKKDTVRAVQAFKHALSMDSEGGLEQEIFVSKNIASLMSSMGQFDQVLKVTESILSQDTDYHIGKTDKIADLYSVHMNALIKTGRSNEAFDLAHNLLDVKGVSHKLIRWIFFTESSFLGLSRTNDARLSRLLDDCLRDDSILRYRDLPVINNLAFALAEIGRLEEASYLLSKVSYGLHKDAYLTATLGLISVRKGNLARAEKLYREAIGLAVTSQDKTRIRQKMNVELGRALISKDARRGRRLLQKAVSETSGERTLVKQASAALDNAEAVLRSQS
ncbi:tetratricopeptide repeat protein [Luteimonas deserti]|uniref:Tetratricopeptide repeat protein n=1 Tax=Luteimonas deserti TaxID=2752306 RepID=A0A7Z0QR84_9GAMM|nr:tetratricopeptide repeat protein [Luteimonas deserti]NYZ61555.1 hypothetical protein [Luteimonas deserti]